MKTKRLIIIGVCLFSSLVLGKVSYATSFNQDDIVPSTYTQNNMPSQESALQFGISKPVNSIEREDNVVEFKDSRLEEAVKIELGIPLNQELTASSMLNLRKIQPSVTGITDLTGLEYASNLQVITFTDNALQSLKPIENLPILTSIGLANSSYLSIDDITSSLSTLDVQLLDLSNNPHFSDFSKLSVFTNLQGLWLNNCNLTNVDFLENFTSLNQLALNNNALTSIHKLNSPYLRIVQLNQNQFETLKNIPDLSTISNLEISNNKLTSLGHLDFTRLISLQADSNNISSLDGVNAPILSSLSLDNNQISSVKNIHAPQLSVLIIRNNQLETLNGLKNMPFLRTLNVTSNKLKDLTAIKELPRLSMLAIQNNMEIDDFTPISFAENLTQLLAINTNMSNNKARQLGKLKNLETLGVSNLNQLSTNEKITNLDFLSQFPALTGIALDGHAVSDVSKIEELSIPIYSAVNQQITLPAGTLDQQTIVNLVDKNQEFPTTIQFITPGELVKDPSQNTQSVLWNQIGDNSFSFSSSDNLFSGSVNQHISLNNEEFIR